MSINHESRVKEYLNMANRADAHADTCAARGWNGCTYQLRRLADTYRRLAHVHEVAAHAEQDYRRELARLTGKTDLHGALPTENADQCMTNADQCMTNEDLRQLCERVRANARRPASADYRARLANLITRFPRFIWSKEQ